MSNRRKSSEKGHIVAGAPVVDLNELEVVEGRLWANMWRTERIVVIDLSSGHVLFYVDCASLEARLPGTRSLEYVSRQP